ncbi:MAG TPA: Rne/Rng family ribonuclease [Pyrinomonadaceae bacterium]|nr:Rne/Rng family ribonuclease [Pyrinomonadaceae bacterium]
MPKELIVSLNGREKKIAIIENGRVTEFYIERGEGSQGIVGNIYKGRVMRVLPGMQSAFVDIGLDRDAFLYVSDFFDEEEEFERIVVDKTKTEGADTATAERAAAERIERARLERERQMESAQELAEPLPETPAPDLDAAFANLDTSLEEAAGELDTALAALDTEQPEEAPATLDAEQTGGRRRKRRGRDRGGDRTSAQQDATPARDSRSGEPQMSREAVAPRDEMMFAREDFDTPFAVGASSFERVVDDEAAAEEGSMFKDARVQERLLDQIRGVEFDIESTSTAEVGSLLSSGESPSAASSFQRIADDDDESQQELQGVQGAVAASVAHLAEEFADDTPAANLTSAQSFERISDDESASEPTAATRASETGTRGRRGGGGGRTRGGASKSRQADESPAQTTALEAAAEAGAQDAASGDATTGDTATEETTKRRTSSARLRTSKTEGASKKTAAKGASKSSSKKGGGGRSTKSASKAGKSGSTSNGPVGGGDEADGEGLFADAEASVGRSRSRGEFARRGGRRRRRPGGKAGDEGAADNRGNGNAEDAALIGDVEASPIVAAPEISEPVAATPPARSSGGGGRSSRGDGGRGDGGGGGRRDSERGERGGRGGGGGRDDDNRNARTSGDGGGGGRDNRDTRGGGDGGSRDNRGGSSGGSRDRRDRAQPTITDLLREGQEIIVQIAKEPIAQKGARITSHIALPGRFLVYMPTIEHVGVSRKIESDAERVRLRKLIQAITREEDVPSGGFIVRTAGVGMSEQDLRDDARYLVRTWRDIRRNSEKSKAPSLAHKDLDLVQRILRDQLSDDFTAIRVDSEEEYLAIVEFINRIQPRLVNRVKLYTREEPILEAYGVQAEIEKAIKPRVWLRSGGYLVINQTEALVAIDVNTGKFVGRGGSRLEDTITRTNLEAVDEIARQIRLRDLGGIIVLDLIDMEDRRNRNRVMGALQDALRDDKSPTKVLSFNDFGLVIMTRKRVKQSLERTLCSPCPYCQGSSLVKSPQTVCYEILEEARRLSRSHEGESIKQVTLRLNPEVARTLRTSERDVLTELEDYLGPIDITSDEHVHQEQFDFALI